MKKALAILYSQKTLMDFIWYYHTFGKNYEWDVLCYPCGGEEVIKKYCVNAGIFHNIYNMDIVWEHAPKRTMIVTAIKMIIYWSMRKTKQFARKYFEGIVDGLDYDLHLVPGDKNFVCGLLITLSSEIETLILEDGLGDYNNKSRKFLMEYGFNLSNVSSYMLSVMGYSSGIGPNLVSYVNKPSCLCVKYSVHPEWMLYKEYKDIRPLRDLTNTDIESWQDCLRRTFEISDDMELEGDVILFTTPLDDYSADLHQRLADAAVQYISDFYNPRRIIIKKHHRDKAEYTFPSAVEVIEVEKNIPGELLLNIIRCKKHIYMFPSTMLVSYPNYSDCEVLKFNELVESVSCYEKNFDKGVNLVKMPYNCVSVI